MTAKPLRAGFRGQEMTALKLKAKDAEDVQVISAILQDSIIPVVDIAYRPEEKDFIMVAQRFRRETKEQGDASCFERMRCAVHVHGVTGAQLHGIDQSNRDAMLDLLAVMPEGKTLQFIFAGGGKIRLTLADWSLILEDFGEAWPAACEPRHEEGSGFRGQGSGKSAR